MAARTLPGFKRESGAARGYINTATGERLSRRQYEKLTTRQAMTPQRVAIQTRAQRNYNKLLSDYTREQRQAGKPITKQEARKAPELARIIKDLKSPGRGAAGNARKRRALEALGRRQGVPDWVPVGLSDRYRKGKLRRTRLPKAYRF